VVCFVLKTAMESRDVLLVEKFLGSLCGTVRVPGLVVDVLAVCFSGQWSCSATAGFVGIPGDCLRLFGGVNVHFVLDFGFLVCATWSLRLIPGLVERSIHAGGGFWHLGKEKRLASYRYPFDGVGSGNVEVCLGNVAESFSWLRPDRCVDIHFAGLSCQGLHVCHIGIIPLR